MNYIINFLKKNNEFLGTIVAIITSLVFIYNTFLSANPRLDEYQLLVITDALNILLLLIALWTIKKHHLNIDEEEYLKLERQLRTNKNKLENKKTRLNELVNQLVTSIKWFVIILLGFYLLQLYLDLTIISRYEYFESIIEEHNNILGILQVPNDSNGLDAAIFLSLEILLNSANLFSAACLFIAFKVLFSKTIEDNNKTWSLDTRLPFAIAIGITICNLVFFLSGFGEYNLNVSANIIRLIGGIFNGVAMFLLFSRFISMEYFFQQAERDFERHFYLYGILVALPLYVTAQPLYGLFYTLDPDSTALFKGIVFLVCFWGKLVFLFFIFTIIKKRWIHAYLLSSLTYDKTIEVISTILKDVDSMKKK